MNNYKQILKKLEGFIRKYYTNELIKGALLFFSMGLLYFLISVGFEFFFWLGKVSRSILFWLFIGVEVVLFVRFLIFPLAKLIKLSKGLDYYEASKIIGAHFPQVNDKLQNVLQLKADQENHGSELLKASIDQKAAHLQPVPFRLAINFKGNLKYAKYVVIPLLIMLAIYVSGKSSLFSDGYTRMVNYQLVYEPPAPFRFVVLNSDLRAQENEKYTLKVRSEGNIIPEEASIHYNGQRYFLKPVSPGVFEYTFDRVERSTRFHLSANAVESKPYTLAVSSVPTLLSFEMHLDYPNYLNKKNEILKGTGSATLPEGTKVTWKLTAKHTNLVQMQKLDTILSFSKSHENFELEQAVFSTMDYAISTSNSSVNNYEKLSYQLKVIPDERPEISVAMKKDSVIEALYFHGKVSDDHGLSKLQLVYYPTTAIENQPKKRRISVQRGTYDEFLYTFPDTLSLKAGTSYEFYFQVFDNDGINGYKSSRSDIYSYRKLTKNETAEKQLHQQERSIEGMSQSLEEMKEGNMTLKAIEDLQKQKSKLNYGDRQKLKNFLERQERQEKLMKDYSNELKKNLNEFQPENGNDEFKNNLKNRLERNEKKLEENEKLFEDLRKYQNKIDSEQLNQKVENLAKHNQNQQNNLEQLVELTKRYYVQKKAEKIASDIKQLGNEQEALANEKEKNSSKVQQKVNSEFDSIRKEIGVWEKENKSLAAPMKMQRDSKMEEDIKKDQQAAVKNLKKEEKIGTKNNVKAAAEKRQKSAAQKLKKIGNAMQQQMTQNGGQQQAEDARMLRQILNNLVIFSFEQEDLMIDFRGMNGKHPDFPVKLRHQNVLKENFEHVDDSLYALALRNPMISEKITEKLTEVSFHMNKALERLAQNELRTGISSQQYVFKNANDLASMLDESLQQMQQQMQRNISEKGNGKRNKRKGPGESEFQLPDIIKKQEALRESLKKGREKDQEKGRRKEKEFEKNGTDAKDGNQRGAQTEEMNGELYEIYKKQQQLRQELEELIQRKGLGEKAKRLSKEMENAERSLLEGGFSPENEKQLELLRHQLLKLKDAALKQNKDEQRQSTTNSQHFKNETKKPIEKAKEYFNRTEILNRQALPLRQNYQIIVQDYFKQSND